MPALEGVSGFATHPAAVFTGLTMGNDTLTIRSHDITKYKARLLAAWAKTSAIGNFRIRSPRLHDNVQGIRFRTPALIPDPTIFGIHYQQQLFSQDTLIAEINCPSDGAGNFQIGCLLTYYENLPGVNAVLASPDYVAKNGLNLLGQDVPITTGAGGGYTGSAAINSSVDNFKANEWYALLGAVVDTVCGAVRVQGADIGNLGVLIPGCAATPEIAGRWFVKLSEAYGLPLIPCFNSANKSGILVSVAQTEAAAAVNVTLLMVELGMTQPNGT
jgi:hypothetical protein